MSTSVSKTELIVWNYIRNHFENQDQRKNVPTALKYLIRNFLRKIFNSSILSFHQDVDLCKSLLTKSILTNSMHQKVKLLFRASEHDFEAKAFHDHCDGHPNTITVIKSNFGNIFGGYTNIPWGSSRILEVDKYESFLFLLHSHNEIWKTPKLWEFRQDQAVKMEIRSFSEEGPTFGWGPDIRIQDKANEMKSVRVYGSYYNSCYPYSYLNATEGEVMCGGSLSRNTGRFLVTEYEVFEII